jgi:hypothetical protein
MICLSYYLLYFLFNKIRWNRFCLEAGRLGEVAQTIYTHVSKCKNDKIKGERKKIFLITCFKTQSSRSHA